LCDSATVVLTRCFKLLIFFYNISVMTKEMIKTYCARFVVYSHEQIFYLVYLVCVLWQLKLFCLSHSTWVFMVWCYGNILQLVLFIDFDLITESA